MSLLFTYRPLVVNPALAVRLGLNEAILLQQLHYWLSDTVSGVEHEGKRWVYNTIEGWHEQFPFMSISTIKRGFSSLKAKGVIQVKQLSADKHDKTNYYTICYESRAITDEVKLNQSNGSNCTNGASQIEPADQVKLNQSNGSNCTNVTETTTEITTETTAESKTPREENSPVDNSDKTGLAQPEDFELARWFWSTIVELYERAAEYDGAIARPPEPNWSIWANEFRLLRAEHGCDHDQIRGMIERVQNSQIWCKQIQKPRQLRDRWTELALKVCSGNISSRRDPFGASLKFDNTIPAGFRG